INLAIEFPLKVYAGILCSILRYDIISYVELLTLLLRTAFTVIILVLGYKVLALAIAIVLAGVPNKILHIYYVKKHMPHLRLQISQWTTAGLKTLFSYSFFTFLSKLAEELKFNVDVIVVTAFLSFEVVTHYRIASIPVVYFRSLLVTMLGIFFPLYCQQLGAGDHEALKKSFFFSTKLAVCIASFVGFCLVALGQPFFNRWMGPEYLDAYPILVILTVGCIIDIAQVNSPAVLFATSKHKMFALYTFAEGLFNLILSLLLVKPYGMIGVALGTLVPLLVVKLVIQPIHICKVMSISYTDYIGKILKTVCKVLVALIIPTMASVIFAAPKYFNLFAICSLSAVSYIVVLWFIELSRDEKEALMRAIAPRLIHKRKTA
ncbi:polysaccharide biosynthesis C-terminal domain-containing protein, partial [bacterium]|nr:polysaccharide biosynthesis C-terminal domain-containing protein [bacterium]